VDEVVLTLAVTVAGTVVFGLYPTVLFDLADLSARSLGAVVPALSLAH
jgi:hypothetical protein